MLTIRRKFVMKSQPCFRPQLLGRSLVILLLFFASLFARNPLENRARGYCDQGNLKLAVDNFGRFAGVAAPYGLWGDFQYISNLSFILGVPGKDKNGNPYPWALGPKEVFDVNKGAFYTVGDDTTYWGPTVSESWFDESRNLNRTDWEAVGGLNNTQYTAGMFYGANGLYTTPEDSTPLIATSTISETWPVQNSRPFWPGHWAADPNDPSRKEELRNIFVSDEDLYFAFDDRYATRDGDPYQGYPTNVRVEVTCHSFSDSLLRDMVFFDLQLYNLSDYDYQGIYAGLYFDADVYHALADGNFYGRTNDDDLVEFDRNLGLTYFYDVDGDSANPYVQGKKLAYIGLQFLQTPPASQELDLDGDGNADILRGDPLGVTGFHWFDWHYLPGVKYIFDPEFDHPRTSSEDKEEIQYKLMAGDMTDISAYDSLHFFHSDSISGNPHFDSVEQLRMEHPKGMDCVVMLTTGPFNLKSGASTSLSFCLVAAYSKERLMQKAQYAKQVALCHYQTVPSLQKRLQGVFGYKLEQNFPNPFNSRTRMVFTLPKESNVRLELFDIQGRKVETILNKPMRKGQHTVTIQAGNLASGLYFYRLAIGGKVIATRKMLLIR